MNHTFFTISRLLPTPHRILSATFAVCVCLGSSACRSKNISQNPDAEDKVSYIAEIHQNNLGNNQSDFIAAQANSPIHWQQWDKTSFTHAASERKTVLALIGSGTNPNTLDLLRRINQSHTLCSLLNKHHVNILIDANIHSDLALLANNLCQVRNARISAPLLVWFSYEGYPISWTSVGFGKNQNMEDILIRMSSTVYQLWRDSPEYVLQNSRDDYQRIKKTSSPKPPSTTPAITNEVIKTIRQAASLFDPTSGTVDGIGHFSPARYLDVILTASDHPDISKIQRQHYLDIATRMADHTLVRGLNDPLDGGVFAGVQRNTCDLPNFSKNLGDQSKALKTLYSLYQKSGNIKFLKTADNIVTYIENNLALPDNSYALGIIYGSTVAQDSPCTWTLEEIETALTKEEIRICTIAFGLRGLGNIPLIDDPDRSYFRKNTLTWKLPPEELASRTSLDIPTLNQKLESITKKLAKLRAEKLDKPFIEHLSTSAATAELVSAYATAFRVTGDNNHLQRAIKALNYIKNHLIDDNGNLLVASYNGKPSSYRARAIDHALVCQAALDLHECTANPTWLELGRNIHNQMTNRFGNESNSFIKEHTGSHYPLTYGSFRPFTLISFDTPSTWALASSNALRLSLLAGGEEYKALKTQRKTLSGIMSPIANKLVLPSLDFLRTDTRLQFKQIYIKAPASSALFKRALDKACIIIPVNDHGTYPELGIQPTQISPGSAVVISRGTPLGTASNKEELDKLLK